MFVYPAAVLVRDVAPGDRARERLTRLGAEASSDRELFAVLLGTGGAVGISSLGLAERLLAEFGGVSSLARAHPTDLCRIRGVGPAKAATLGAAFELARRIHAPDERQFLASSSAIAAAARPWLVARSRERAVVLSCDNRLRLLGVDIVSEGAADSAPLPVREVLAAVLRRDGVSFAVAHNHPGGDPTPSRADIGATERVCAAAEQVGLRFLDHVVIAGADWRSITPAR